MPRLFEYVAIVRTKTRDAFIAAHPNAFLLHRYLETPDTGDRGFKTATVAAGVSDLMRAITAGEAKIKGDVSSYDVYPVLKKPDSPYPSRFSIGRTRTNDVAVNEKSISKLHAYIQGEPPGATLTDANSRNGVTLNGATLQPGVAAPLAPGDSFGLGSAPFVYYDAGAFYDFVKSTILK